MVGAPGGERKFGERDFNRGDARAIHRLHGGETRVRRRKYEEVPGFKLDGYLRGRAQERNEEKPLYRAEPEQGYIHYNKGALVMYALQDYIAEEAVSRALADFTKTYAFKGPPYPTSLELMASLKKVTPPEFQDLSEDLFENIIIYDNRTRDPDFRAAT